MGTKRNLDKVPPEIARAKYSGPDSNSFWLRVRHIKDRRSRIMCFELGCALQDIEYRLLRAMEVAEKPKRVTNKGIILNGEKNTRS
jgi:hypothetical protein